MSAIQAATGRVQKFLRPPDLEIARLFQKALKVGGHHHSVTNGGYGFLEACLMTSRFPEIQWFNWNFWKITTYA
jgi:hypothetical protein